MVTVSPLGLEVLAAILLMFCLLSLFTNRRNENERRLKPLITRHCAGKVTREWTLASAFPIWRLSLYEEFFVLSDFTISQFKYSSIHKLECRSIFGFTILHISVNDDDKDVEMYLCLRSCTLVNDFNRSRTTGTVY